MKAILDTNVARNFAYEGAEETVEAFTRMKGAGVTFHLADLALLELLRSVLQKNIAWARWIECRNALGQLLHQEAPIIPSGKQLLHYPGIFGRHNGNKKFRDAIHRYRFGWEILHTAKSTLDFGKSLNGLALDLNAASQVLRGRKIQWVKYFEDIMSATIDARGLEHAKVVGKALNQDHGAETSTRLECFLRVFTSKVDIRLHPNIGYNAERRANDAIDIELLTVLGLPAILCTTDNRLLRAAHQAKSFQSEWVMTPTSLAQKFDNGTLPDIKYELHKRLQPSLRLSGSDS